MPQRGHFTRLRFMVEFYRRRLSLPDRFADSPAKQGLFYLFPPAVGSFE
jgi:hypothetical protein